jgi:hypothetical protein
MTTIEPREIEIKIVPEENKEVITELTPNINKNTLLEEINFINNKRSSKNILTIKQEQIAEDFKKLFRMVTTSVDYKSNLFYQRVKFILESNRLIVYDYNSQNKEDPTEIYNPLLVINFDQVTVGVSVRPDEKRFSIFVLGYNDEFKFQTQFKEIYDNVLIHLNYYIETSVGSKTNLMGISLRKDFYKVKDLIKNEELLYIRE